MTSVTFFEIGGDLIELNADYEYATGQISATKRKQQRAIAKERKVHRQIRGQNVKEINNV